MPSKTRAKSTARALASPASAEQTQSCPSCKRAAPSDRGAISPASIFAGLALDNPLSGGRLLECRMCGLSWRTPFRNPSFYEELYAKAKGDEWQSDKPRRDHQMVAAALQEQLSGGDVLDIGCGNGALLGMLPAGFQRFGVEIGLEARAAAQGRGVELVAASFDELSSLQQTFDAVVVCDVIEHSTDPREFVAAAINRLRRGGLLILSTGNADAWLWRVCGGKFWYCQFAEHLTFISPRWLASQTEVGAELLAMRRFAYNPVSAVTRIKSWLMLAFYMAMPAAYNRRAARRCGWSRAAPYFSNPPGQGLTQDHLVATLRRI
jgi:2-polyprenyl-3-methyl-5-hydroxy-6-metoxy-1,4-benzoquinol methylase